jgi:alkylation response protein AidB-like acyl-CoA dehydrogenase
VQRAVEDAIAGLCAEALGAMTVMLDMTVEYLKVRKQFGSPLSRFQALQHKAAEMYVAVEQVRSMTVFATMMLASPDAQERANAARVAKVAIGREGRFVGENAIQLHGGIGMTMENAVAHYFKRVTMIDLLFGDADTHLAALADAGAQLV